MAMVAVPLVKQPKNRMGTVRPSMIFTSEEPGLISVVLIRDSRLVLLMACPTTNMEAIMTTELLVRPPQASLKDKTPVISRMMGMQSAAT